MYLLYRPGCSGGLPVAPEGGAKDYDPTLGRFLTEDPSRKGHSWYSYCVNNPLTYTDPTGMREVMDEDRFGRPVYGDPKEAREAQSKWLNDKAAKLRWREHVSKKKEVWSAFVVEMSLYGYYAGPDSLLSSGGIFGMSFVKFTNEQTGESFAAEYTFEMKNVLGGLTVAAGLTIAEYGIVKQSFPRGTGFERIAESFEGLSTVVTASPPIPGGIAIAGSLIRGEKYWTGGGISLGIGIGAGYAAMEMDYKLRGIQPPGTPSPFDNLDHITR